MPPRDETEAALIDLWQDLLGVSPIGVTDDFFALGGNSLQVLRLMSLVAHRFGCELPLDTVFRGPTIGDFARVLRSDGNRTWDPVVPLRAGGTGPPLFCFHPAVGTALCYVELARHLPPEWPVLGVHATGIDEGTPLGSVAEMSTVYADAVVAAYPEGPYLLAGYCIGSVLAIEVARRLRTRGHAVPLVVVLDGGPSSPDSGVEEAGDPEMAAWFAWELGRAAGRDLVVPVEVLRDRSTPRMIGELLTRAVATDVLPAETAESRLQRMFDVFLANARAVPRHRLEPYDGPVVAYRAEEEDDSPAQRWKPLVPGLRLVTTPGDHYSMMRAPHVEVLARALGASLQEALAVASSQEPAGVR